VNRQLGEPARASVDVLLDVDHDRAAMPSAETSALKPLVERWRTTMEQSGYDVRGELGHLTDRGEGPTLPGPRDQLSVAVDALADVMAENTRLAALVRELQADRDKLDRKRRTWKSRAKEAEATEPVSA
jgi:hypothetical protein